MLSRVADSLYWMRRYIERADQIARVVGVNLELAFDCAPRDVMRSLADECLIACAFFEGRLRRNGTVRHYVGLGQATYDAADLTEQAYGFVHMRDVIASAAGGDADEDGRILIDRARAGSATARAELARQNVVPGPWGGNGSGLLWR